MTELFGKTASIPTIDGEEAEDSDESALIWRGSRTWTLLLVDRRDLIRGCLRLWLNASTRAFKVISAESVSSVLSGAAIQGIDLIALSADGSPSSKAWLDDQIIAMRALRPELPVVLIGESGQGRLSSEIAGCGVFRGYIPTSSNMDVALAALNLVAAGGSYMPVEAGISVASAETRAAASQIRSNGHQLTPRETAVLRLLERGLANKNIGFELSMSESTVKVHVRNIMKKLRARNRTEAVALARSHWLARDSQPEPVSLELPIEAPTLSQSI